VTLDLILAPPVMSSSFKKKKEKEKKKKEEWQGQDSAEYHIPPCSHL